MAITDEMTDAEIDQLLERFDQTEPKLQRRIVAEFVVRVQLAEESRDKLLGICRRLWADHDATNDDQAAQRRLYNAWLDVRDAVNETTSKPG